MNPIESFEEERRRNVEANRKDAAFIALSREWMIGAFRRKYMYNYTWLGRPIIQLPGDILAVQEILWTVKPDLVIETGIAHGGSLILSASILDLLGGDGQVLGVDIDIRRHNFGEIVRHPMYKRITLLEGSSVDETIAQKVQEFAKGKARVVVCLDSHHTHAHVLRELELYAPLTTVGSYCVVFDTIIDDLPDGTFPDRPWGPGNNPKTALREYLRKHDGFEIDKAMEDKVLLTAAPDGFLKRVR